MRLLIFLAVLILISCVQRNASNLEVDTDTVSVVLKTDTQSSALKTKDITETITYSNARFKNVVVQKTGPEMYRITGKGQIFEASFNWTVEDGQKELKSGYATTEAGAPAWGSFDFNISVKKPKQNAVLHLILYEISAENGSRQHELPIALK